MPTTQQAATDIVNKVKKRLSEAEGEGIYLKVTGDKLDDDWLYTSSSCRRSRAFGHRNMPTICRK